MTTDLHLATVGSSEFSVGFELAGIKHSIITEDRLVLENSVKPVIVTLRTEQGDSGLLRRQIIRAIGVDLLAPELARNTETHHDTTSTTN
jgi:vacuolar-type H+-ATPase subunit F/Vma7